MHIFPTSTITFAPGGRIPAHPGKTVGRSGLAQNDPRQEGQASIGQQNEGSHQRAHAPDLRLRDVVGVPARGSQSDVPGANRGQFEAEKETAGPHARGVFAPRRSSGPGTMSHHGDPGALHGREMLGVGRPEVERFDWQNLSVYIRRAIVAGRVDDVKTEYSEAPLPLDPATIARTVSIGLNVTSDRNSSDTSASLHSSSQDSA
jgi:hypothetical protein